MAELLDLRGPYLLPLLVLLVTRAVLFWMVPVASEDAYITFRYARNLAGGHGLVFNPGERVMGFSSPLWTVWMALGETLGDPVVWSRVWTFLSDVVALIAWGTLLSRHASRAAAACFTVFFASWPYFSAIAFSGMEISTMVALIPLAALCAEAGRVATGPLAAALALLRPEGAIVAAAALVVARMRDRLVALALFAAGLAGLFAYFGTIVPQSLRAKAAIYGTPGPWSARFWWDWVTPVLFGEWPKVGEATHMVVFKLALLPALVVAVPVLWRVKRSGLAAAIAGALAVWIAYAVFGVAYFYWYLAVPLVGIVAAASIGLPSLVRGKGLALATLAFLATVWSVIPILYIGRAQSEAVTFGAPGQYLKANARPGERVFLEPIGMIGYLAPLVVIDEIGLVSPDVAVRRLQGPGWYTDVVRRHTPEWLVLRQQVLRTGAAYAGRGSPFRSAEEREALLAGYARVFPEDDPGDLGMIVLRRR